jgi:hypothetical protein
MVGAVASQHRGGEKLAFNQVHSTRSFGGYRGDALEHTEYTSAVHMMYEMESCTAYISKLHEICRFWWYECMCIVVSTGEQEVCKARTSEKAGRPWNIRKTIIYYILPYAPGELQMESEMVGCLYPCGGAI